MIIIISFDYLFDSFQQALHKVWWEQGEKSRERKDWWEVGEAEGAASASSRQGATYLF